MNNSATNNNLLKWILLGILVYMNLGSAIQFINMFINFILLFTTSAILAYNISDISFIVIRIVLLSGLFSYLIKNLEFIYETTSINKFLIVNLVLLPIFLLINTALGFLFRVFLQRNLSIAFFGQYTIFSSMLGIVNNVVNIILLVVFGVILLMQKPSLNYENKVE